MKVTFVGNDLKSVTNYFYEVYKKIENVSRRLEDQTGYKLTNDNIIKFIEKVKLICSSNPAKTITESDFITLLEKQKAILDDVNIKDDIEEMKKWQGRYNNYKDALNEASSEYSTIKEIKWKRYEDVSQEINRYLGMYMFYNDMVKNLLDFLTTLSDIKKNQEKENKKAMKFLSKNKEEELCPKK